MPDNDRAVAMWKTLNNQGRPPAFDGISPIPVQSIIDYCKLYADYIETRKAVEKIILIDGLFISTQREKHARTRDSDKNRQGGQ